MIKYKNNKILILYCSSHQLTKLIARMNYKNNNISMQPRVGGGGHWTINYIGIKLYTFSHIRWINIFGNFYLLNFDFAGVQFSISVQNIFFTNCLKLQKLIIYNIHRGCISIYWALTCPWKFIRKLGINKICVRGNILYFKQIREKLSQLKYIERFRKT